MVFKSIFMLLLYYIPYSLVISGIIINPWIYWLMWIIMGIGMAGIGLSVMHDAKTTEHIPKTKTSISFRNHIKPFRWKC